MPIYIRPIVDSILIRRLVIQQTFDDGSSLFVALSSQMQVDRSRLQMFRADVLLQDLLIHAIVEQMSFIAVP